MNYKRDIEQYLKSYPALRKWINECPICHSKGYRPDMPDHIGGEDSIAADNIRKFFRPMEVDEAGLCMTCSKLQKRK